jgi:carbonic anhydrase/acetyltransferase-like protein (isoleucine patch superfamily)
MRFGAECIVMENAVIRGAPKHRIRIGDHALVGPRAYLTGCNIEDNVFLAAGSTVFNVALIGEGAEVRVNGVVHVNYKNRWISLARCLASSGDRPGQ